MIPSTQFSDYVRMLYKRRWVALPAFAVVFLYAAIATLRQTPVYAATTQVLLETDAQDGRFDDELHQTQYRMMQSRAIAWRSLAALAMTAPPTDAERRALSAEDARLAEGGWLERITLTLGAPRPIPPPSANETGWQSVRVDRFLAGLTVVPVPNSRLVDVQYRSADPVFAAKAAEAVAEAYIAQALSFRVLASPDAKGLLNTQLSEQKQKLATSEQALEAFKAQHGAAALKDPQDNPIVLELSETSAELTRVRSDRFEKAQLLQATAGLRQDPARLESIRSEFDLAKEREDALDEQLRAQQAEALAQDNAAIGYAALERDVISNRQLYGDLMQRAKVTGVNAEYKGTSAHVIDAAEIPRAPVLPNHQRDLIVGLLTGLVLALGLAFGFEVIDTRIKSPDDIKAHLALPFLGLVPAVQAKQIRGPSPLLDRGVPAAFSESMRGLRTSVIFSSAADGARSVMVTSTAPGEGKTVIATNLAGALAQAEQRTIIVDGDMRRPRVHETFQFAQEPGLSNVLAGTVALAAAIRKTNSPYLHVLPAGLIPTNPSELLGSSKYLSLLEELGSAYDWIVIDAPPVMAVTDAAVISSAVNGVVFVVGSEMTPRRNAQIAVEQLLGVKATIVGAVLNLVQVDKHSFYYAQYYRKDYTQTYVRK